MNVGKAAKERSARAPSNSVPAFGVMQPGSLDGDPIRTSCRLSPNSVRFAEAASQSHGHRRRNRLQQSPPKQRLEIVPEPVVHFLALADAAVVPSDFIGGRVQVGEAQEDRLVEVLLVLEDEHGAGCVIGLLDQELPALLGRAVAGLSVEDSVEVIHELAHGRPRRMVGQQGLQAGHASLVKVLAAGHRQEASLLDFIPRRLLRLGSLHGGSLGLGGAPLLRALLGLHQAIAVVPDALDDRGDDLLGPVDAAELVPDSSTHGLEGLGVKVRAVRYDHVRLYPQSVEAMEEAGDDLLIYFFAQLVGQGPARERVSGEESGVVAVIYLVHREDPREALGNKVLAVRGRDVARGSLPIPAPSGRTRGRHVDVAVEAMDCQADGHLVLVDRLHELQTAAVNVHFDLQAEGTVEPNIDRVARRFGAAAWACRSFEAGVEHLDVDIQTNDHGGEHWAALHSLVGFLALPNLPGVPPFVDLAIPCLLASSQFNSPSPSEPIMLKSWLRRNPHGRICGGPRGAIVQVYPIGDPIKKRLLTRFILAA